MALAIIGAGFGRTGTSSLRDALNTLGYPCYHMTELLLNRERRKDAGFWERAADTPPAASEWVEFFGDSYSAAIDFPTCAFWRPLMAAFPEAKVVLSVHPGGAEAWYDSTRATIFDWYQRVREKGDGPEAESIPLAERETDKMMTRVVYGEKGLLRGAFLDRDTALQLYETHNQSVRDEVPPDRLVDWSADQGWVPICDALGIEVPDTPFPRSNQRGEMSRRIKMMERMSKIKGHDSA